MVSNKQRIAIIGTGIAGMGAAHLLYKDFDIHLYEKNDYIGGHTNTVYVQEGDRQVPIDTGFIVCNNENYPNLMRLFNRLQVPLKPTDMSFSAQHNKDGVYYHGSSLDGLFAQRKNLFSLRYWKFLLQVKKFNESCIEVLEDDKLGTLTIEEYAKHKGLGFDFLKWYILPMSSALWSTPVRTTMQFPVRSLVRFFKNHGLLGLDTQFQWYTVDGGSEEYKKRLIEPFKASIKVGVSAKAIELREDKVLVTDSNGQEVLYDKVVVATHADEALSLLKKPTEDEKRLLSKFEYQVNDTVLHTDEKIMPDAKKVWSSWNYVINGEDQQGVCTYWMNCLQGVSEKVNYFVTLNGAELIDKNKILRRFKYEHPVFTVEAMNAQSELSILNTDGRIFYCGSYFKNGFHEDALKSAVDVCSLILGRDPWS